MQVNVRRLDTTHGTVVRRVAHNWTITVYLDNANTEISMRGFGGASEPPDTFWEFVAREVQAAMAEWGLTLVRVTEGAPSQVHDMRVLWEEDFAEQAMDPIAWYERVGHDRGTRHPAAAVLDRRSARLRAESAADAAASAAATPAAP
jgi:hypothetical protein